MPIHRSGYGLSAHGIGAALPNGGMLPAGYLLKKRTLRPLQWLNPNRKYLMEVCSVSNCVNENEIDVQGAWQHNGFGVANNPKCLLSLMDYSGKFLKGSRLFYYTAYELELESDGWEFNSHAWRVRSPVPSAILKNDVAAPPKDCDLSLMGYDVVVSNDYLEHSPLSCNNRCKVLQVNGHCLMPSLDAAIQAVDAGAFGGGCEPGNYSVFAVHLVTPRFETR